MAAYQTEQKKCLTEFMSRHSDRAYTVEELAAAMQADPTLVSTPGKSTIYRLLTGLVQQGKVKRFVRGNSRQFTYQIVTCEHCDLHLHLKCTDCGKLLHIDDDASALIFQKVLESKRFCLDEGKTILFGRCQECNEQSKPEEACRP